MSEVKQGDWIRQETHVLSELKRLSTEQWKMSEKMDAHNATILRKMGEMQVEVGQLKVKAGVWGLMAGMVTVIIAIGIDYLKQ